MMTKIGLIVVLAISLGCVFAESDGVVDLTAETFKDSVKDGFWLVEFYAPWCGHCKKLAPTWEHLGKELKGKANIAKVDCTAHKEVCSENGVKGFPTIKLLENGQEKEKYAGARTTSAFVSFLKEKAGLAQDVVVADAAHEAEAAKPKAAPAAAAEPEGPSDVVSLTQADFDEKTQGFWFIKFYAPWCGHCKRLAPAWDQLATELKGKANIAKVDCTIHSALCSKFGVKGYPTLKLIKDGAEFKSYSAGRDLGSFAKFLKENEVIAQDVEIKAAAAPVERKEKPAAAKQEEEGPSNSVVLSEDSFDEKTKEGTWFVKFYAPWCGHCKKLAPAWEQLSTKVNLVSSPVRVAKVDCTQNNSVCSKAGIKGYPTLKLFKDGNEVDSYRGARDLDSLVNYVKSHGFDEAATPQVEAPKPAHEDL